MDPRIDIVREILDRHRGRLAEVFESIQPSGHLSASEAWEALEASRRDLLEVLERGKGMRLEDRTHDSPVTGEPMNAYQWFAFTSLHEGRHAAQLEEIAAAVGT